MNIKNFLDPTQKIFEGAYKAKIYKDTIEIKGLCFHCSGKIVFVWRLSRAQGRDLERDEQYRKNTIELCTEKIQEQHQCSLLDAGKDSVVDLHRALERESRK